MTTNYPGIDYSMNDGTNQDAETGIRYGMISCNSVSPWAMDDVYQNGDDIDFEEFKDTLKDELESAIRGVLEERGLVSEYRKMNDPEELAESIVNDLEWDNYEGTGDCTHYAYEDGDGADKLVVQTSSHNEMWVFKSPFYTRAQFCSPCVPGAGNLDTPCDAGPKTYCLPPDWFDEENPCPHPIYRVADDVLVYTPAVTAEDEDEYFENGE